jgi:hypothetical protein
MHARRFGFGAGIAALLVAGTASADVVRLRNGDLLEGRATDLGESVQVIRGDQTVVLPWSQVEVVRRDATAADEFESRRATVKDSDAKGLLALALWARRQGLLEESRSAAEAAVAAEPGNAGARELLGEGKTCDGWKCGEAMLKSKGFVHRDGRWMLQSESDALDRRAARESEASEEEKRAARLLESLGDPNAAVRSYAAESLASVDPELKRRMYMVGARHRNPAVRQSSAAGLGVKGDEGAARTLLQLAVKDSSPDVRAAAARSLRALGIREVAKPLVRSLDSENAQIRMNAAEAMAILGDKVGVETLVRRVHWVAGSSGRVNIQSVNQVSYISDYDVEIAQLAQIGDPIVQQLREGTVLDVRVFSAEGTDTEIERRTYTKALGQLTGKGFGDDTKAWVSWWNEEGRHEAASAAKAEAAAQK